MMSPLDAIIEELRLLPAEKLEMAADYIRRLKRISQKERRAILASTFGSVSKEDADEMEKAIEEGCEKIDESHW